MASSGFEGRISWFFSTCGSNLGIPLTLQWGPQGHPHVASVKTSLHESCRGASRDSSAVTGGAKVLIWSSGRNHRVPIQCQYGTQGCSGVSTGESGLVCCGDMQVRSPLKLQTQRQASRQIDMGIGGFLLKCHRAITTAIASLEDPWGDRQESTWEFGVLECIVVLGSFGMVAGPMKFFGQAETTSS